MKALTLTQPWAQLIVDGRKRFETRGWHPRGLVRHGEMFAIHAAKGWTAEDREVAEEWGYEPEELPRACIVAIATLKRVIATEYAHAAADEAEFGDYTPGRWAWELTDVTPLSVPVPCRGALGLWLIPDEIYEQVANIVRMDDGVMT